MTDNPKWDTERLLQALRIFLVENKTYDIVCESHKATLTFASVRKGLVKDTSKYVERIDGKMPKSVIVTFKECDLIFTDEALVNAIITARKVEVHYEDYKVVISENRS